VFSFDAGSLGAVRAVVSTLREGLASLIVGCILPKVP